MVSTQIGALAHQSRGNLAPYQRIAALVKFIHPSLHGNPFGSHQAAEEAIKPRGIRAVGTGQ
jgi:hypothetical protein